MLFASNVFLFISNYFKRCYRLPVILCVHFPVTVLLIFVLIPVCHFFIPHLGTCLSLTWALVNPSIGHLLCNMDLKPKSNDHIDDWEKFFTVCHTCVCFVCDTCFFGVLTLVSMLPAFYVYLCHLCFVRGNIVCVLYVFMLSVFYLCYLSFRFVYATCFFKLFSCCYLFLGYGSYYVFTLRLFLEYPLHLCFQCVPQCGHAA